MNTVKQIIAIIEADLYNLDTEIETARNPYSDRVALLRAQRQALRRILKKIK